MGTYETCYGNNYTIKGEDGNYYHLVKGSNISNVICTSNVVFRPKPPKKRNPKLRQLTIT